MVSWNYDATLPTTKARSPEPALSLNCNIDLTHPKNLLQTLFDLFHLCSTQNSNLVPKAFLGRRTNLVDHRHSRLPCSGHSNC